MLKTSLLWRICSVEPAFNLYFRNRRGGRQIRQLMLLILRWNDFSFIE